MKMAISMGRITMEREDHETEVNESIIDSNNIHFFRVDNKPWWPGAGMGNPSTIVSQAVNWNFKSRWDPSMLRNREPFQLVVYVRILCTFFDAKKN